MDLVSPFACNTRVTIDASSNPLQDSHPTCKISNKYPNVYERVQVMNGDQNGFMNG